MNIALILHVLVHCKPHPRKGMVICLYYIEMYELCLICKFVFTNESLTYGDNMPLQGHVSRL